MFPKNWTAALAFLFEELSRRPPSIMPSSVCLKTKKCRFAKFSTARKAPLPMRSLPVLPRLFASVPRGLRFLSGACSARASFLHPANVFVVWEMVVQFQVFCLERLQSSGIRPPVNFRMPIGKRQSGGVVVVSARIIDKVRGRGIVGIASHVHDKVAIVDALVAFIDQHECWTDPDGQCQIPFDTFASRFLSRSKADHLPNCSSPCCECAALAGLGRLCRRTCPPGKSRCQAPRRNSSTANFVW